MNAGVIRVDYDAQTATVWLDNPGKKNAISLSMWKALGEVFEEFHRNQALRCIVLRGAGDDAFGSGADISEFAMTRANRQQATNFASHVHSVIRLVGECPIPTLAAIRGICVGGGLELAAVCDLRICTDNSRFSVPIARLGATLAYAELQGLQDLVGPSVALELLLEGRTFLAPEALAKGLVGRVVPLAEFDAEVRKTVSRVCKGAPLSARRHKRFVRRLSEPAPLSAEEIAEGFACFDTEDYQTGYRAFLDKTQPIFIGK